MTKDELTAEVERLQAELTAKSEQVTVLEGRLQEADQELTRRQEPFERLQAAEEALKIALDNTAKAERALEAEQDAHAQAKAEVERLTAELKAARPVLEQVAMLNEKGSKVLLVSALAVHLQEAGVSSPEFEALTVLAHLADVARHSTRFGEATVRALMALPE